jgi:molybdate transport system substrate-binding protein
LDLSRFVWGENVSPAAQFIESGSAEAGIIALSLAVTRPMKQIRRLR